MTRIMPQIEHVVLMVFENRSLDNVLGWLYTAEGNRPPINIPNPPEGMPKTYDGLAQRKYFNETQSGKKVFAKRNTGDYTVTDPDPNEEYEYVRAQLYGPSYRDQNPPHGETAPMSGFLQDYEKLGHFWQHIQDFSYDPERIMECYTPEQLPVINTLARQFAVSDAWFSSAPTQTNANRAFLGAGTSCGKVDNGDLPHVDAKTIWNVLSDHHVDWKIFRQAPSSLLGIGGPWSYTQNLFTQLANFPDDQYFPDIDEFFKRVASDTLPAFSFIEPHWLSVLSQGNSYHPNEDVRHGEKFLRRLYDGLTSNPAVWNKTLLIVTFDEHGGNYDHVPPPWTATPPDDASEKGEAGFGFDRFGVRVPTLLISPYVQPGTVFRSEDTAIPYDHTSIIKTVLRWQGIACDESIGLGRRMPKAPTFENVLAETRRDDVPAIPPRDDEVEEGLDAPLTGLHTEQLKVLANYITGGKGSEEEHQGLAADIRTSVTTLRELKDYIDSHKQQPAESSLPQWLQGLLRRFGLTSMVLMGLMSKVFRF